MQSDRRPDFRGIALAVGLAAAFSPVLVGLGRYVREEPFGPSLCVAPILLLLCLRAHPPGTPRVGAGTLLLGAGLAMELLGLAGGSRSIANWGLPLAAVGFAVRTASIAPELAVLACWLVPLPEFLFLATTPFAESAFALAAVALLAPLGWSLEASGPLIRSGDELLEFQPGDSGLHLAWMLALVGYYGSLRRGARFGRAVAVAAATALLALPGQLAASLAALAIFTGLSPDAAQLWLRRGVWPLAVLAGVGFVEWRRRR